jgi:cell cycle sensor histidine kinase DivJ
VNLAIPVRDYVQSLVHPSAREDACTAARHRAFMAPRLAGGLAALALLPVYLVARKVPAPLELVALCGLLAPIGVACFLSRTGRYQGACLLSALTLAALVAVAAMMSGGIASFAAAWLIVVPLEAALYASRRVAMLAAGFAAAAVGLLLGAGPDGLGWIAPSQEAATPAFAALCIGSAAAYAALLARATAALASGGAERAQEESYRALAAGMADVITRHGGSGTVLFASPAAERLLNVAARDLTGQGLFERVHVADRPLYLTALSDAAASGRERSVELRLRPNRNARHPRFGRQFIWVEMRCRALPGAAVLGNPAALPEVVAVMRDITDRKAQETASEAARSEAEQANAAKSRFLATMSHELRTPLNAVIGFSEMLMNENAMALDAPKRLDYARLIHDSGHHLLSVVNLVLDMSKIETGNFVITPESFAPAAVVRGCADLLALKARESGIDLAVQLPRDLPEIVADKRALKQMLLNLLSNAVKFTEPGGRVTLSAAAQGPEIAFAVADTGIGIDEEDLPRVGDAFFQACGSYARPYEGTGLGLSIVKGLVALHGGRMEIASRRGEGTCVTVRLPVDCESRVRDQGGESTGRAQKGSEPRPAAAGPVARLDQQVKKRA